MTGCEKSIFRLFSFIAIAAVMLGQAMPAYAAKVVDVSATRHNLSTGAPTVADWYSTDESQVCIFCHTPHNANPAAPLWNQYSTTMTFTVYSSATLTPGVYNPLGLPSGSISRLCLSCHEGTTAMNSLVNPGQTGANPTMKWDFDQFTDLGLPRGAGPDLSDDLSAMHPVGFDYYVADLGDPEIKAILTGPVAAGLKFFDGSLGEKFLECSTCHDPHVNGEVSTGGDAAYEKFLRIPNTSSSMCLACHNK